MKFVHLLPVGMAGFVLCSGGTVLAETQPPLIDAFRLNLTPNEIKQGETQNARSIATQAYLYQIPVFLNQRQLADFIQAREFIAPQETPLGGWLLVRQLSTPKTTTVMPNVDTLYGATYLWSAKQGPVVLMVPAIENRYYSVGLYDSWYNVFGIVGTRTTGSGAGSYLIVPPDWKGDIPPGIKGVYRAPTEMITLFQRIYISEKDDINQVRSLQDQIRLTPLANWNKSDAGFPKVDDSIFRLIGLRQLRDPLRFFALTNEYTAITRPPSTDASLIDLFKTIGIGPGVTLPKDRNLETAISAGAADAQNIINATVSAGPFRNGWRVPSPNTAKAGPYILSRAVIQVTQVGSLPNQEAMYFFCYRDGKDHLLDGRYRYTLTFPKGQLPPIEAKGFWSLTMYNKNGFLVESPINRYIIRPDTPGLTYNQNGSLTLYLQNEQPKDAPQGNWLPAPKGEFSVTLRAYMPKPEMINGTWFPPGIVRY